MVCNFRVRFDEYLHVTGDGNTTDNVSLPPPKTVGDDSTTSTSLVANGQAPSLVQGKADQLSQITNVVPLRASVDLPGYRQAGRFTLDLLYRDFPFDPDLLRSVAVEIHLGTVSPADWGAGNTQQPAAGANTIGFGQSPRSSRIPVTDYGGGLIDSSNLAIFGLVDKIETTWDAKGFMTHMEGRDLTGLLCDLFVQPTMLAKLNVNQPINKVVQQIIHLVPLLASVGGNKGDAVQVMTYEDEWPKGIIPAPGILGDYTRVNLGVGGGANTEGGSSSLPGVVTQPTGTINKLKVWDVITQECGLVGGVPFFVGNKLWIRPAIALYDPNKQAPNALKPTPFKNFKPRQIDGYTEPANIRTMSFGRDILSLKKSRKLGGFKVPTIQVVGVDTSSKQRGLPRGLSVYWPPIVAAQDLGVSAVKATNAKRTAIAPSGQIAQTEPITISVPGIRSPDRLLEIAKNIYEEIGRGEVGGSCSTKDLWSLGGDNSDPDLLYLRPGDPVRFTIDNRTLQSYPPPISTIAAQYRDDPEQLARALTDLLGDATLGRVLAYSLLGHIVERQNVYRVNHVRFTWDEKKGVAIDFDFQNYIEARAGITTLQTTANRRRAVTAGG